MLKLEVKENNRHQQQSSRLEKCNFPSHRKRLTSASYPYDMNAISYSNPSNSNTATLETEQIEVAARPLRTQIIKALDTRT